MSYLTSGAPDITETLPTGLAGEKAEASSTLSRNRTQWDISIDGIGFNLDVSDQRPYIRESAPTQKQQTDVSAEAGEQTLDGLWIRSQTSWHLGAGASFYEPGARDGATPSQYRFDTSVGVDVWNEGDLRLLKATSEAHAATTNECYVATARSGGTDIYFTQVDGVLKRTTAAGTSTSYTPSSAAPTGRVAIAGSKILVGATSFGIDVGDVTGTTLGRLYTQAIATTPTPYWVKGRIIAVKGRSLYELALDGTTGGGDLDTVTALFTHPDTGWAWSSVAESPTAVLAAGYSNGVSAIYAFTLETSDTGTTPELGQPFQVAEFPPGEEVHSIRTYLGTYVGIGTSRGLRIALLGDGGTLQYGPLLFETDDPIVALAARDRFLYAGVTDAIDGSSGAVRVDLSKTIGDGLLFPWAYDAQTHGTGTVNSIGFVGLTDRVVVGVASDGVYVQSATAYEDTGYLTSGKIRYGTTEGKAFRFADVRARTADGLAVSLTMIGPSGEDIPIVTVSQGATGANLSLGRLAQRLEYAAYKLTLAGDGTSTPVVESVALKAVPAVRKQRLIQYPVMMHDKQHDSRNTPAWRKIADLLVQFESLEETKAVVTVNDYRLGESFPAIIESFRFVGSTPPRTRPGSGNNIGGRGEITVRRL